MVSSVNVGTESPCQNVIRSDWMRSCCKLISSADSSGLRALILSGSPAKNTTRSGSTARQKHPQNRQKRDDKIAEITNRENIDQKSQVAPGANAVLNAMRVHHQFRTIINHVYPGATGGLIGASVPDPTAV